MIVSTIRIGRTVRFRVQGSPAVDSRLSRIIPRASTDVRYPALAAQAGGCLPVKLVAAKDANESSSRHELLKPHFEAIVAIDPEAAVGLHAGQTASLSLGETERDLGRAIMAFTPRSVRVVMRVSGNSVVRFLTTIGAARI